MTTGPMIALPLRLPARLDDGARLRCLQILAGEWRAALLSHPDWDEQILHVIAPGRDGRERT
jgi:hypothetical protein